MTALIAIKPVSGILAPYWSQAIHRQPDKLTRHLCYAQALRYLPLALLPWVDLSAWMLCSYGLTMTMEKASIPAWMELLKRHLNETEQAKTLSQAHMIDHIGDAILAIPLGWLLDRYGESWRGMIATSSLIGLCSIIPLYLLTSLIPRSTSSQPIHDFPPPKQSQKRSLWSPSTWLIEWKNLPSRLSTFFLQPWKESGHLLRQERDFARYLFGFMLGGAGLMIVQPALPSFFIDTLHLSFTEMGCAITFCRAIGSLSAPFWSRAINRVDFSLFSSFVTAIAILWPLCLLGAQLHFSFLYLGYFLYGVMQAGSHLSWHLSGVLFAKERESTAFSTTNVLMVGVRGCVIPTLGTCILSLYGADVLLCVGMSLLCAATLYFVHTRRQREHEMQARQTSTAS